MNWKNYVIGYGIGFTCIFLSTIFIVVGRQVYGSDATLLAAMGFVFYIGFDKLIELTFSYKPTKEQKK